MNPQITQISQKENREPKTYAIIGAAMEPFPGVGRTTESLHSRELVFFESV
jgi:hypothetical protein